MRKFNLKQVKSFLLVDFPQSRSLCYFRFALILFIFISGQLFNLYAQTPQKMSYQAVMRNSSGQLLINKTVGLRISILKTSAAGTTVYTETQTPTSNSNGLVSIQVGGGAGFSSIDWGADSYYIKTEVDPAGGTSYSITSTTQLLSVPYALYAANGGASMTYPGAGIPISTGSAWGTSITDNSTNWNTAYANRISTFTTNGNSGASAFSSNTLNIPNYTLAGLGGIGLTALSASPPLSYNSGTGAFSIQTASGTQDGYLTSANWSTFNSKQNALTNPVTSSSASASNNQLAIFNGTGIQVTPTTTLPTAAMPALSGDVTNTAGSFATTLNKIQGTTLSISSLTTSDILKYNGTNWVNTQVALPAASAGAYTVFGNNTSSAAAPAYFSPLLASGLFQNQGATNQVLHGNAAGNPSWSAVSLVNDITGTLTVGNGGTGATTLTSYGVLYGNGTSAIQATTAGTDGQILVGKTSNAPLFASMSGDATITNAGALTIANNAVTTAKINAAAVTYAKIQNAVASSLLGNPTGSAASPSAITLGSGLSFSGTTLVNSVSGAVTGIGTLDGQTKAANGAVISGNNLYMQSADASNPGLVTTGTQTFAGAKTFNTTITAPTSSNTINGLIVNSGALSGINGLTYNSGAYNFDQSSSTGTFKTGSGAVSINGDATMASGKTLYIGGTTSGTIGLKGNGAVTSYTLTLPSAVPSAGQVLSASNGTGTLAWSGSLTGVTIPFNNLIAATSTNTVDNTNYAQTWNWSTANTGNGLSMNFNALTSGSGLSLASSSTSLTGSLSSITLSGNNVANTGSLLSLNSSGANSRAQALYATSASTGAFANGGVRFNFSGAHTGNGFQIDDVTTTGTGMALSTTALTSGTGLKINGPASGATLTGNLLNVNTNSTGAFTDGGVLFDFKAAHTGHGFIVRDQTTSGIAMAISVPNIVGGSGLAIIGPNSTSINGGNLLSVATASTGNFSNGGVFFNFVGDHTNYGFRLDDYTTTGKAMAITASNITTGSALEIVTTNSSLQSAGGFFRVLNNSAASGSSPFVRLQPNSTAGSGITLTNDGNVGIGTAPTNKLEVAGNVKATRYVATSNAVTAAATTTLDLSLGNVILLDMGASITTMNISNANGPQTFIIKIAYSSATAYTIAWPASFKWSAGVAPTLTCANGKVDIISVISDGVGNYYCTYALNF